MSRFLAFLLLLHLLVAATPGAAATEFRPTRFSVTVRGSGPDVILIPGLAASPSVWSATAAAVPGYRYHFVQVAGFAGAPAGGNARGPVAAPIADEIARYIAANRLDRPALVGHSMGGTIAMMVGARHPRAAGRVMVVDMLPSAARPFGAAAPAVRPIAGLIRDEMQRADRFRRTLQPFVARFGNADWLNSRSDTGVVARSLEEVLATDLTPELRRIRAPLTIVYACSSTFRYACAQTSRIFEAAYARRPGTLLVRIEGSGHSIMQDKPAAFRAALRHFLSQ